MRVETFVDRSTMSQAAAQHAATSLSRVIASHGKARLVAATGASQLEFLEALVACPAIDWSSVEMFHLDEYVGLSVDHPASFRRYLIDRLIAPTGMRSYHLLEGENDPVSAADRASREISAAPIDIAFVGIGENAHLAFNDPPADFDTEVPYLIVDLDKACRQQQVGEGWFASLEDVPSRAISMSVGQILRSKEIICVVPDRRKAAAVKACLEGPISPAAPASVLRTHANTTIYLDRDSAAELSAESRGPIIESAAR